MKRIWDSRKIGAFLLALCLFLPGCGKSPNPPEGQTPSEIVAPGEGGDLLEELMEEELPEWDEAPVAVDPAVGEEQTQILLEEASSVAAAPQETLSDGDYQIIAQCLENTRFAAQSGEPESDGIQEYIMGHASVALLMNGTLQNAGRIGKFVEQAQNGEKDGIAVVHGDEDGAVIWSYQCADGTITGEKIQSQGSVVTREAVSIKAIQITEDAYIFSEELGLKYFK